MYQDDYRRDCFWHDAESDMGATLHFCEWHYDGLQPIKPWHCRECKKYVNYQEAHDYIRKKFIVQDKADA